MPDSDHVDYGCPEKEMTWLFPSINLTSKAYVGAPSQEFYKLPCID